MVSISPKLIQSLQPVIQLRLPCGCKNFTTSKRNDGMMDEFHIICPTLQVRSWALYRGDKEKCRHSQHSLLLRLGSNFKGLSLSFETFFSKRSPCSISYTVAHSPKTNATEWGFRHQAYNPFVLTNRIKILITPEYLPGDHNHFRVLQAQKKFHKQPTIQQKQNDVETSSIQAPQVCDQSSQHQPSSNCLLHKNFLCHDFCFSTTTTGATEWDTKENSLTTREIEGTF